MNEHDQGGTIAVDLDGTLAHYQTWQGVDHIGRPIPRMLTRVKMWLKQKRKVVIFTARVSKADQAQAARKYIDAWCEKWIGQKLPITATKTLDISELWDDRAIQVKRNTGERVDGQ